METKLVLLKDNKDVMTSEEKVNEYRDTSMKEWLRNLGKSIWYFTSHLASILKPFWIVVKSNRSKDCKYE